MRIYRLCPKTKARQYPVLDKEGYYVLGAPEDHSEKHHAKNKHRVSTEQQVIDLVRRGYSVRVGSPSSPRMVRLNLFIDGLQFT